MKSLTIFVLVALLAAVAQCKKVKVGVYYETICPGCQEEIVNNLDPARKAIGEYMDIELVPWGNARADELDDIFCQHGALECEGNKMHACVLDMFDFETAFQLIVCSFSSKDCYNPPAALRQCAQKMNMDWNKIKSCADSDHGLELSLAMGKRTPRHDYVPWTLIDGKGPIHEDIKQYICENFLKDQNVPACNN